jgi:thymidylate synthase
LKQYLDLLARIMKDGTTVQTGAYLPSEGRQPTAKSLFATQFRHDLADGFPAVTSKRFFFASMVKEMLWFLRGETNVQTLGCNIWNDWAGKGRYPEGECGPIYGMQWRRWEYPVVHPDGDDTEGNPIATIETWDQVGLLVADLKAVTVDPNNRARRRLILTGWNPPDVPKMGLPPCHTMAQFLPVNGVLNCHCFWRSIDAFTGMPFNVGQYALLTHILAAVSGLAPGVLVASVTDLHIYDNQFDAVAEQLTREPLPLATLGIDPAVRDLAPDLSVEQVRMLTPDMFHLDGYVGHASIRAEVAV